MLVLAAGSACVLCVILVDLLRFGRSVSPDDLPGTYRADDYPFERIEVLVLREDHTFEETFTSEAGSSYSNSGRWRAEVDGKRVTVVLDNAIIYSLLEPPLKQEWRLKARRGLRGGLTLSATEGDPDGVIELRKTE